MKRLLVGFVAAVFFLASANVSFAKGGPVGGKGGSKGGGSAVSKAVHGAKAEGLKGKDISKRVHQTQAADTEHGSAVSRAVHEGQSKGLKGKDLADTAKEAAKTVKDAKSEKKE